METAFTLSAEWQQFRLPLSDFQEVDFASLAWIRFVFGTEVNPDAKPVAFYLDDVAAE